jgi:hypothetical protein
MMADLIRSQPDVIVTRGTPAAIGARYNMSSRGFGLRGLLRWGKIGSALPQVGSHGEAIPDDSKIVRT